MVGTWYVNESGKENRAQRLALRSDGTFAFIGSGWKSSGQYSYKDNTLALAWTHVDGAPVQPGSMHKNILLAADGTFNIDRYTYAKHLEVSAQQ